MPYLDVRDCLMRSVGGDRRLRPQGLAPRRRRLPPLLNVIETGERETTGHEPLEAFFPPLNGTALEPIWHK